MIRIRNMRWIGDAATGHLRLLDQTLLPTQETYISCRNVETVYKAIRCLSVRGAPAIGIAAAYGCVIGAQSNRFEHSAEYLATSRPTAVNLFWAIERMKTVQPSTPVALLTEAQRIHEEDDAMCQQIGEHALAYIDRLNLPTPELGPGILTHCNAGALATGGIGTATAPMYLAHQRGRPLRIYADETRPLLQGSRLTAFELTRAGIDVTLICDDTAARVMHEGYIDLVITGADRITANGDTANKIGTYNLAVLAKHHGIPFAVAAPSTTFDLSLADGSQIPIEFRGSSEITEGFGQRTAPEGIATYCPAFDVTPHDLISTIVTERGLIKPVDQIHIERLIG